jgi:hypothetical protein
MFREILRHSYGWAGPTARMTSVARVESSASLPKKQSAVTDHTGSLHLE